MNPFLIRNLTETSADLYLYGEIVSTEWDRWSEEDVAPESMRKVLDELKGRSLNIYINSGGGSVFAGLAIYHMLKRHEGEKIVHVDGVAASIASVIALAGDKVIIPSNAFLMIHKPWQYTMGDANELRKAANDLDRIEEGILNVYAEHLQEGVELATIKTMVTKETWLNGAEASKYFRIETAESLEAVACDRKSLQPHKYTPSSIVQEEKSINEPQDKTEPQAPTTPEVPESTEAILLSIDLL